MRIAIVGSGTMGAWFAELVDGWLDPVFVDDDPEQATAMAARFDASAADIQDVDSAPVVCTAVPMRYTDQVLTDVAPLADQAVVDLSGTMAGPLEAMRTHAAAAERISIHALFAPEHAPGNVAAVTEGNGDVWAELRRRLEAAGNDVFETNARAHDQAMETVQAKVHAAVIAFALAADPVDERFHTPISSELTTLARTVLSGTSGVYADIQETFDGADELAAAAAAIAAADRDRFEALYRDAASDGR